MTKILPNSDITNHLSKLPSLDQNTMLEIIKGIYEGKPLIGQGGLLTQLIKELTQLSLQGEMDAHLSESNLEDAGNRRNGLSKKLVKSPAGSFELEVPRDRNGSFQPQIVKKRQTILNEELDNKILSLYALGASYEDIGGHLYDIYGVDVSPATITAVTDRLVPELTAWRNRPLESVYAIVFLDAMFFKTKQDNKMESKAVYNIMGINKEGRKEILGFYACETEGAHFWLGVLNDLKTRGVKDILIACIDGLKGFPEAISAAFPKT